MKTCHECRFYLTGESNPYARCLIFYNQGVAKEILKDGLIGRCAEFKEIRSDLTGTHADSCGNK